jgi:hemolysin activation/secretion protein
LGAEEEHKDVFILPPVAQEPAEKGWSTLQRVYIREIEVTGSTVFSPETIAEKTAPYEDRDLTMADLESLRRDLTLLYVNDGYVNSGAVIPDQTVTDGTLTIAIVGRQTDHHSNRR